jgi:hypothetical protein
MSIKQLVPPTYITEHKQLGTDKNALLNKWKQVRQKMVDSIDGSKLVLCISI